MWHISSPFTFDWPKKVELAKPKVTGGRENISGSYTEVLQGGGNELLCIAIQYNFNELSNLSESYLPICETEIRKITCEE